MRIRTLAHVAATVALAGTLTACSSGDNKTVPPAKPTGSVTTSPARTPLPTTKAPTSPAAPGSASAVLSATAWKTTAAKDANGASVPLTDARVKMFVGYAYFKTDGTFTMFNLDDSPKMQGDWSVSSDGKTRTVIAKDANGKVLFKRKVDIVTLTKKEFTYRVFPDPKNQAVYFDIIHTPTDHPAP